MLVCPKGIDASSAAVVVVHLQQFMTSLLQTKQSNIVSRQPDNCILCNRSLEILFHGFIRLSGAHQTISTTQYSVFLFLYFI